MDNDLGDGTPGRLGFALGSGRVPSRTVLGFGIADPWNPLPCIPLAEPGMAQWSRTVLAAPGIMG